MHWEEPENPGVKTTTADMIDVSFRIKGSIFPVGHQHALAVSVTRHLPWFRDEPYAGIHPIRVAPTAHGWSPPPDEDGEVWQLSKRTRLTLRIPIHREHDFASLEGKTLDIEPEGIAVGRPKIRQLAPADPLFSRHVVCDHGLSETCFVDWLLGSLETRGIAPRKVVCGRSRKITTPDTTLYTRSVLVASLNAGASVLLQCQGLGKERVLGCGLFVPHKGIEPVRETEEPS